MTLTLKLTVLRVVVKLTQVVSDNMVSCWQLYGK